MFAFDILSILKLQLPILLQDLHQCQYIYQFLFEADYGMYGDGEEPYGHETLVGDARVLREKMEYYFASEITTLEETHE